MRSCGGSLPRPPIGRTTVGSVRSATDAVRVFYINFYVAGRRPRLIAHGLLGQSFDGDALAIDGRQDDAYAIHTRAQAEGGIEGRPMDYRMPTPFATSFVFSRFNASVAVARSTDRLNTPHRWRREGRRGPTERFEAPG